MDRLTEWVAEDLLLLKSLLYSFLWLLAGPGVFVFGSLGLSLWVVAVERDLTILRQRVAC